MSNCIEQLKEKRQRWVTTNKENDFEDGITSLLTELYPDNAHFIYELLQNAEDAGAKKVSFELRNKSLVYSHNGKRLFAEEDVEAITNIGKGTKRDDINKIGKFGVGFKAVFAYTISPSIYSGPFCFMITDLVVPNTIAPIDSESQDTVFEFPFNNPNKNTEVAFNEIKDGLNNINRTTLLFLSSIESIEINICGVSHVISKRTDKHTHLVTINNTKLKRETKFLVFNKALPNEDKLYVSIAFKLSVDEKTKSLKTEVDNEAKVSIYFPAEKETSNLKFHIHAPFASTVARDSIKDLEENNELIALIAELACEATEWAKENQLLNDNFLQCLPNKDDNLSDFYRPIQTRLVERFNNHPLFLCEDGYFHPGENCWQSTEQLKRLILPRDLNTLFLGAIHEKCYWLVRPYKPNSESRSSKFLKLLKLKKFSELDFKNKIIEHAKYFNYYDLSDIEKEINNWILDLITTEESTESLEEIMKSNLSRNQKIAKLYFIIGKTTYKDSYIYDQIRELYSTVVIKRFLSNRNNEWLKALYKILYKSINSSSYHWYIDNENSTDLRIFLKLNNGYFNYRKAECYFPSKTSIEGMEDVIVSSDIYDENPKRDTVTKMFLQDVLGVKEIDIKDEVKHVLGFYKSNWCITFEKHIEHIKLFLKYFKECNKYEFDKSLFGNEEFLITTARKGSTPSCTLLDKPIKTTNLSLLKYKHISPLGSEYFSSDSVLDVDLFSEFLKVIGCVSTIPIREDCLGWSKRRRFKSYASVTKYCIDKDYFFDFEWGFPTPSVVTSRVIWDQCSNLKDTTFFDAIYQANKSSVRHICDSDIIDTLKNNAWIPDKNEEFHRPENISVENLHQDFKYDNKNGWLTRIGFGQNVIKNQKLESVKDDLKKHTGYELSTLKKAQMAGLTEDELIKIIEEKERKVIDVKEGINQHNREIECEAIELTPSVIINTEEFRDKTQKSLLKNIAKSEKRGKEYRYSRIVKVDNKETKEFLKQQYLGHCQICGFTFSQTNKKGNYFEMFDWLSKSITKQKTNIIQAGTGLSLCSRCHSVLKYGDFGTDFLEEINNIDVSDFDQFVDQFNFALDSEEVPEVYGFIEMDMYKLPIRKLKEKTHIFFSEEHFIHFYNALTLNNETQDEDSNEGDILIDTKYENIQVDNIIPEKVVEIGDVISLKYSSTDKLVTIKLVYSADSIKDSSGNNLIAVSSPFGKLVKGKEEGHVFELGKNVVKIININ